MFAQPRLPKSSLPPSSKKRKTHSAEEIAFDQDARAEYLTGFHKRKVQRQKHAQEIAAEKARQEKIRARKQLRDERKQAVEDHVNKVNELLREAQRAGRDEAEGGEGSDEDEWNGFEDDSPPESIDHEAEYVDEDRYTTVTVEAVSVDREGLHRPEDSSDDDSTGGGDGSKDRSNDGAGSGTRSQPKKKKKKFRYESKMERQVTAAKQRSKKRRG